MCTYKEDALVFRTITMDDGEVYENYSKDKEVPQVPGFLALRSPVMDTERTLYLNVDKITSFVVEDCEHRHMWDMDVLARPKEYKKRKY